MDLYDLQESDHKLLEKALGSVASQKKNSPVDPAEYRNYLKHYLFNFERVSEKKNIFLVEEDPRIQQILQSLLLESASPGAECWLIDSVEEVADVLNTRPCDLLVANYYLSEDEIDYEFWERMRGRFPDMEVILLSHVNDRDYYEMLKKLSEPEGSVQGRPLVSRLRSFFENVFGG